MMRLWLLAALLLGVIACADDATGVEGGAVDGGTAPDAASDVITDAGSDVAPLDDGPFDAAIHPPPDDVVEVPCRQILVPNESPVSPSEVVCVPGRSERCMTGRGTAGFRACDGYGQWGVCLATDLQVIRDNTTGMWRHGAPIVLPPRLVAPLSGHRVTSRRPTLRWVLPEGMTRARVELCEDRACTRRVMQTEVTGSSWRPTAVLNPGVVFWRVSGLRDDDTVGWTSATWEFGVGYRDTRTDTIGRTLKDFNGDGFDDAVVSGGILLGSRDGGRAAPAYIVAERSWYTVGDVNGDGYADLLTRHYNAPDVGWLGGGGSLTGDGLVRVLQGGAGCPFQQTRRILQPALYLTYNFAAGFAAGDFNGDGFDDVVASFSREFVAGLTIFDGGADGPLRAPSDVVQVEANVGYAPGNGGMRFIGDVDRDGYSDLAIVASSYYTTDANLLHIYYGNPEGRLGARVQSVASTRSGEFVQVVGGDFTGDGFSDLVVTGYNSFQLFVGSTEGLVHQEFQTLGANFGYVPSRALTVSSPGDLNTDGLADLILDERFVYRSLGAAGFSRGPTADLLGMDVSSPGDLDADGVDDVLAVGGRLNDPLLFFRGGSFNIEVPNRAWGGVRLPVPIND